MAAILEKLRHPLSIGIFCLIGPIYPVNLKSISASVLLLLSGNQIQDGCHGGHIGKVTTPIFIRVLLLDSPNPLYEFQIDRCKRSHVIELKPNSRWLPWRPYWKSYDTHFQKGSCPTWSQSTLCILNWSVQAFCYYTETKFKMAAMAAILDKLRHPFSIGFFSFMVPIHPMNFKLIGESVLQLLNGNPQFKMAAMAAILEKLRHPFSICFLSFMDPIHPMNFK